MAHSATVERSAQEDRTVSAAVVSAVAELTGSAPDSIDPLYTVVDPDALDALFEADRGRVAFTYCGCDVDVSADGSVHVSESE